MLAALLVQGAYASLGFRPTHALAARLLCAVRLVQQDMHLQVRGWVEVGEAPTTPLALLRSSLPLMRVW